MHIYTYIHIINTCIHTYICTTLIKPRPDPDADPDPDPDPHEPGGALTHLWAILCTLVVYQHA